MMKTILLNLGIGVLALVILAGSLIAGLGNYDFLASLLAAALFLAAGFCASPTASRPWTFAALLTPLLAFAVIYTGSGGWKAGVLGFFGSLLICASLATTAGLALRRGIREQRLARPIAGLVVVAIAVTAVGWFLPIYADRQVNEVVSYAAPDIHFTDLDGKPVDLKQLRGKVVVLDFWATWCGPCLHEMPALDAMAKHYGGNPDVSIYAIAANQDETADVVSDFLKANHYGVNAAYDADGKAAAAFHALTFPTLVLIDAKGRVRYVHNGFNTESSPFEAITAKIDALRQGH